MLNIEHMISLTLVYRVNVCYRNLGAREHYPGARAPVSARNARSRHASFVCLLGGVSNLRCAAYTTSSDRAGRPSRLVTLLFK